MVNPQRQYFMYNDQYYSISEDGWAKLTGYVLHYQIVEEDWLTVFGARELSWAPRRRNEVPILDYPIIWRTGNKSKY